MFVGKIRNDYGKEDGNSEKILELYILEKIEVRLSKLIIRFSININISDLYREDVVDLVLNKLDYRV